MAVADFAQGVTDSNYWAAHLNSMKPQPRTAATASTDTGTPLISTGADGKSFFENVLDVVNPLQHLPVVGTVYRAITGEKIGDLEKIAGDTLYGGVMGLASSVADLAFEKITGKSFGDTMLAMVEGDKDTAVASAAPATTQSETAKTAALNAASLTASQTAKIAASTSAAPLVGPNLSAFAPPKTLAAAMTTPANKSATTPAVVDISPQTDALLASLQRNGVTGSMQAQAMDAYRRTMSMNSATTSQAIN